MYYRLPKEYLIPVVTGDIVEEYIEIEEIPLEEEHLVERVALEEADKEFIESQIKRCYLQLDKNDIREDEYFSKTDEYYSKINDYKE